MTESERQSLRYPIGTYQAPIEIAAGHIEKWIQIIEDHPQQLRNMVEGLTAQQLDTPYRAGGWTIRQVVHHIPDSHVNCYVRFKWTLTEDKPFIKAYFEDRWAGLADSRKAPIEFSLNFLAALHAKWVYLLKGLTAEQLKLAFIHPETKTEVPLDWNIGNYAWHCQHHYAHIANKIQRENW